MLLFRMNFSFYGVVHTFSENLFNISDRPIINIPRNKTTVSLPRYQTPQRGMVVGHSHFINVVFLLTNSKQTTHAEETSAGQDGSQVDHFNSFSTIPTAILKPVGLLCRGFCVIYIFPFVSCGFRYLYTYKNQMKLSTA